MALFRDNMDAFVAALEGSPETVGYPAQIVLKDYWVSQVLRELHLRFPGTFIFKGGTSLSKGWGLIERMSEDVDILVLGMVDETNAQRKTRLLEMSGAVSAALPLAMSEHRAPGSGAEPHRADMLAYDSLNFGNVALDAQGVLLETGFGEGWEPHELIKVSPLLATAVDRENYDDLATTVMQALQPVRTLAEKLHALHSAIEHLDAKGALADARRIARHYYDIYCCLGHPATLKALEDKERMSLMYLDVQRISTARYGVGSVRPAGGYGASPAFQPGRGNERRQHLEDAYETAKELMSIEAVKNGRWPAFGMVLKRVEEYAHYL